MAGRQGHGNEAQGTGCVDQGADRHVDSRSMGWWERVCGRHRLAARTHLRDTRLNGCTPPNDLGYRPPVTSSRAPVT